MSSMRSSQHQSWSADDLRSKAQQSGNEERVGVNFRKLIEGILSHYSSDFAVFRELIQNADDAKASSFSLEIKCDGPSSSSLEMDFHNSLITEIRTNNDGLIFSETDWKRVATIAEGNTDTLSVGRFGVGFFSTFSYSEEPMIVSGNEYMIFNWRDKNCLITLREKLPIQQQSKTTSIILKMREKYLLYIQSTLDNSQTPNEGVPTINLTELKAYFAKVLSFTRHIRNLVIKINNLTVFEVYKKKLIESVNEEKWVFQPQPSINNMLLMDSFSVSKQILTIANGPSIILGHVAVKARLNVEQQFHNHVRRILNKSLPSIVEIQLLFVPIDVIIARQQLQTSVITNDLNTQIFNSILPIQFLENKIVPSGYIFIGLGTHQSTGIGMHVSSHLIPTVERENLDLQDPYIGKWNKELLLSIGQVARWIYDQSMFHSSHSVGREHYDSIMAPYSFQTSVPNKQIGTIIVYGFFASKEKVVVPVKRLRSDTNLSLVSSTKAFLADSKHVPSFLSFSFVPFELIKNDLFTILKERRLINYADKSLIENKLARSILSSNELISLLSWFCSDDVNDHHYIKRVLSQVRFRQSSNSGIILFGELDYYYASNISSFLPLPSNVLPISIAEHFSQEQLKNKFFLSPCVFKDLIDFYLHKNHYYLLRNPKTSACLLSHFSKDWNQFSQLQWAQIKSILSANQCIPTTKGMKLPNDSYIPSLTLNPSLPSITLNLVSHKTSDDNLVSIEFLKQIGCRMIHIPSIIDDHSTTCDNLQSLTTKMFIENLIEERKNMTDADFNALKQSKFLRGTTLISTETTLRKYSPENLHFPFVAKKLQWSSLLIIDWEDIDPNSLAYTFLKELGVREVPDLNILINRISDEHNKIKSKIKRRKTEYKLPISLQFFAKNFSKHYSTMWDTIKIQEPFLPSYFLKTNNRINVILSTPDKVFTDSNPLFAILLPQVVELFKNHLNISVIGIKAKPTVTQAFDILMERKNDLLKYQWACEIFAYLNQLDGLNQQFKEYLSEIAFIPLKGIKTLMKPSEVFIRSNFEKQTTQSSENPNTSTVEEIDTSGLIDYVNFGPAANSFLLSIGVRNYPSPSMLAQLLIDRQANYLSNLAGDTEAFKSKLDVYTECLRQLAIAARQTSDLQNDPIQTRLQNEPWCVGIRRCISSNNHDLKEECRVLKPSEIYLDDDYQCAQSHNPWCSSKESILIQLYKQFGAKWLSDCVQRQSVHVGK